MFRHSQPPMPQRRGPMRPSKLLILPILFLAACRGEPSGDVATVAEQALTQEQLLGYMARAGRSGTDTYALADAFAEGWLDLALVAEAVGQGLTPEDTALQREVLAPQVLTEHLRRLQNALAVARNPLTEAELERTFRGDSLRLYQRILVRVPNRRNPLITESRRARADSILALAQAGAPFDRLAMELSEGPRASIGGYLAVVTRSGVSAPFRDSLWAMEPGGVSPVLADRRGLPDPPTASLRGGARAARRAPPPHRGRARGLPPGRQPRHGEGAVPSPLDGETAPGRPHGPRQPGSGFSLDRPLRRRRRFARGSLALALRPTGRRASLPREGIRRGPGGARLAPSAGTSSSTEWLRRGGIDVTDDEMAELRTAFVSAADSLFATFAGADGPRRSELVDSIVGSVLEGRPTRCFRRASRRPSARACPTRSTVTRWPPSPARPPTRSAADSAHLGRLTRRPRAPGTTKGGGPLAHPPRHVPIRATRRYATFDPRRRRTSAMPSSPVSMRRIVAGSGTMCSSSHAACGRDRHVSTELPEARVESQVDVPDDHVAEREAEGGHGGEASAHEERAARVTRRAHRLEVTEAEVAVGGVRGREEGRQTAGGILCREAVVEVGEEDVVVAPESGPDRVRAGEVEAVVAVAAKAGRHRGAGGPRPRAPNPTSS